MNSLQKIESSRILPLQGGVQHYDWGERGERAVIPRLLGQPPEADKPYAELWIGAHPLKPAQVQLNGEAKSLLDIIRDAPEAVLGAESVKTYGGRLPFLLKVLAASKALSIQAHPAKKQAERGFARENKAGIPLDAPHRNYKDDNHKPELIVALTDFYALNRFRPYREIAQLGLQAPELQPLIGSFAAAARAIRAEKAARPHIKALYRNIMTLPQADVDHILTGLVARLEETHRRRPFAKSQIDYWVLRADKDYSSGGHRDRGLFSLYLLNLTRLAPGEGIYLGAGELHAYLEGAGVEVMANSDNVLRGGLTPKHVDLPELLGTLTFSNGKSRIIRPDKTGRYPTPTREFALSVLPGPIFRGPKSRGADILLSTESAAEIVAGPERLALNKGESALLPAALGAYTVRLEPGARIFRCAVP